MATGSLPDPNKPPKNPEPDPTGKVATTVKPAPKKFAPKAKKK